MNPNLPEPTMLLRLGDALSTHSTNEPLAVATEWGIRNEALMRRAVDLQLSLGTAITGIETTATRRRRREFNEAAQFHDAPEQRNTAARPAVNWHEGGDGPALLLLNGSTASGLVWPDAWLRRLEKRYRVIRLDNRGTGWSRSAPHPFTVGDLADDARNVLRACGIGRATVLGLSLGGMIAQEFALRHPKAVDKLVLVGTRPPTPAQIPSPTDALLSLVKTPPPGRDLRAFFVATWSELVADGFAAEHPEVMAEIADQIVRRVTPRRAVLTQARAIWSWHGAARLRRIDAPTTVVHGDRDPLLPVGNGMRLARLIPDATYLELPGVGHLVPQEAGDVLLQVLER
jgi:pimeloyl-ACP methyl ester carboxylesterase